MSNRNERFEVQPGEIEIVKKSNSGLIVTPDVIAAARVRVAAGEDPKAVAADVAIEDVFLRGELDNA